MDGGRKKKRKTSPYGRYYMSYFGGPGQMKIIESIIKVDREETSALCRVRRERFYCVRPVDRAKRERDTCGGGNRPSRSL